MGMEDFMKQAMEMQQSFEKCTVCHRALPPGTPMNKLYDDEMGSISVCADCSLKAILWYVRNIYGKDEKKKK